MLCKLVNDILKGKEKGNKRYFEIRFFNIEILVDNSSQTKVYIIEPIDNELDDPFEIMFPTLVYFVMTNHQGEGYSNYNLVYKKIKEMNIVKSFKKLRKIIRKSIEVI